VFDLRHHGSRATSTSAYEDALIQAWEHPEEKARPFIFDNVFDAMRVCDALPDILKAAGLQSTKLVGAAGISLGAMIAWFWAGADERVKAVVPMIGVQSFRYAIANDCWHARAASLPSLFAAAEKDLGRPADADLVEEVWRRIAPTLLSVADAGESLRWVAPRPMCVLNNAADPRTPRTGTEVAVRSAAAAYIALGAAEALTLIHDISAGRDMLPPDMCEEGHMVTDAMWAYAVAFLKHALGRGIAPILGPGLEQVGG
jgi:hypothetical protein